MNEVVRTRKNRGLWAFERGSIEPYAQIPQARRQPTKKLCTNAAVSIWYIYSSEKHGDRTFNAYVKNRGVTFSIFPPNQRQIMHCIHNYIIIIMIITIIQCSFPPYHYILCSVRSLLRVVCSVVQSYIIMYINIPTMPLIYCIKYIYMCIYALLWIQ